MKGFAFEQAWWLLLLLLIPIVWLRWIRPSWRAMVILPGASALKATGTSARGTLTKDNYSLAGISAALDKIATDCK